MRGFWVLVPSVESGLWTAARARNPAAIFRNRNGRRVADDGVFGPSTATCQPRFVYCIFGIRTHTAWRLDAFVPFSSLGPRSFFGKAVGRKQDHQALHSARHSAFGFPWPAEPTVFSSSCLFGTREPTLSAQYIRRSVDCRGKQNKQTSRVCCFNTLAMRHFLLLKQHTQKQLL